MSTEPETLSISVAEEIKTKEASPGTPASQLAKNKEENLPPEEIEKRQKIMLEYTRLSGRYCEPHKVKSRWVTEKDMPRVLADGKDMVAMCALPRGKYNGVSALAHSQIENKDPLRFFVLPNGQVVINAIIINHTKALVDKKEGCMSYPDKDMVIVQRYNRVTVLYQSLEKQEGSEEPKLSKKLEENVNGGVAHVFQHELSHLNGSYIYNEDFSPESSLWFGEGEVGIDEVNKMYE